ncbi:YdeI/OmpD-associated family protein [Zunongwangia atlantica]|uniref:Bacteriocin-protection protein, YdeI/OmpD-associated family n=1 Tax=Zunongwangia atlantica 22II14-10F7 TaxID=1185767 RepID=A0A1Y1T853_9FLAO|nr:YdeI/OmpD-associated family protein [Zunongwangia atlantica]ORL46902.1 hypothetical protein IIF7_02751 [Zunongwangia atlantica 22II14-10F7]
MKEAEEFCPKNKEEWRNWLKQNHADKDAVWLIFYRKTSPKYNLSWSESVDESLCFGWIDSTKKTIDSEKYKQYFTKRKAKSNWSKVNKEKIQKLIDNGLMAEAGLASIEIAKENGSWTFLDAIENLEIPNDLLLEFSKNKGTLEYFESLSKSDKKSILYWVISAKREQTREKRILDIVENACQRNKPKQFR